MKVLDEYGLLGQYHVGSTFVSEVGDILSHVNP
jgi:hypothetical protein